MSRISPSQSLTPESLCSKEVLEGSNFDMAQLFSQPLSFFLLRSIGTQGLPS